MKWVIVFLVLCFGLISVTTANALSDLVHQNASSAYVLPYPSSMPGNLLYRPRLLLEIISKSWFFGNFGQFTYNLKQSDKYLVEAKTLFEYGQYLHASSISLKNSDEYFKKTLPFLLEAKSEGKNISDKRKILSKAAQKHVDILKKLSEELPLEFQWIPEKEKQTTIYIRKEIENSISIRSKYL